MSAARWPIPRPASSVGMLKPTSRSVSRPPENGATPSHLGPAPEPPSAPIERQFEWPQTSENVIDNFVDMYAQGLTPNPCVECNRSVKFDHFIDQAKKLNCEKVATGHYAKIVMNNNMYELHKADYLDKDQSYVLHMLDSQKLENIEFPLGTISKPEVRQIVPSGNSIFSNF